MLPGICQSDSEFAAIEQLRRAVWRGDGCLPCRHVVLRYRSLETSMGVVSVTSDIAGPLKVNLTGLVMS
jgi:hypothetical protein